MRVYVVRHSYAGQYQGKKEDRLASDDKRALLPEGLDMVDALIDWLSDPARDAAPNSVTTSPLTRAMQTGQRIAKAFGLKAVVDQNLDPGKPMEMLIKRFASDPTVKRPLIVAHSDNINPGLRRLNSLSDLDPGWDPIAMCELRWLVLDRSDSTWKEKQRVLPSDLGGTDYY